MKKYMQYKDCPQQKFILENEPKGSLAYLYILNKDLDFDINKVKENEYDSKAFSINLFLWRYF